MKMIFRKLDENDPGELAQFNQLMEALSERPQDQAGLAGRIARLNAREDAYLMAAQDVDTGRLCGSLLAVLIEDLCGQCRPVMVIENVITHPDFQRRGVGKAMFAQIEAWGQAHRIHYAILCSSMERTGAHKFYASIGYGEVKGYRKYF